MGFTRYYTINSKLDPQKFVKFSADCKYICDYITQNFNIKLAGYDGEGDPTFSDNYIVFNGKDDLAHETFSIGTEMTGFQFTKTNLKPYDRHVYACLTLVKKYFQEAIKVSGDGEIDDYPDLGAIIQSLIRDRKICDLLQ
jgi:hypothetical protein